MPEFLQLSGRLTSAIAIAAALVSIGSLAAGCGDAGNQCGVGEPEGCLPGANTALLYQWTGTGTAFDMRGRLASQGDHLVLVEPYAVRRLPKDGSAEVVVATPEPGHRFVGLAEDGGYVYYVSTNQSDPSLEPGTLLVTEIHRVAPDGSTIDVLADTVAPVEDFAVSGDEAFVWFAYGGGYLLDRVDLATGTKTETALPVTARSALAVGPDFIDYLGKSGSDLVVVRLDRASATLVSTTVYGSTSLFGGPPNAGPKLVGDVVYFGSGLEGNDGQVYSYPASDPSAVAPVAVDPSWRAELSAIAGDAAGVYFQGFFERRSGDTQLEGWFGTGAVDTTGMRYTEVAHLAFSELTALAVDETHLYTISLDTGCREGLSSCTSSNPEDWIYDRRLLRIDR